MHNATDANEHLSSSREGDSVQNVIKANAQQSIPVTPLVTLDGDAYEILEEGSLGILAMGYEGIMLWREKRKAIASSVPE